MVVATRNDVPSEECPICFEPLLISCAIRTPCGHRFCRRCLDQWWDQSSLCPLCRQPLFQFPPVHAYLRYVSQVRAQLSHDPEIFICFTDIVATYKRGQITRQSVRFRIGTLFAEFPLLIQGFNELMPAHVQIR